MGLLYVGIKSRNWKLNIFNKHEIEYLHACTVSAATGYLPHFFKVRRRFFSVFCFFRVYNTLTYHFGRCCFAAVSELILGLYLNEQKKNLLKQLFVYFSYRIQLTLLADSVYFHSFQALISIRWHRPNVWKPSEYQQRRGGREREEKSAERLSFGYFLFLLYFCRYIPGV